MLRGLLRSGVQVSAKDKIGDVDPRAEPAHCYRVSDKALAVGGGVLEAVMGFLTGRIVVGAALTEGCRAENVTALG